MLEKIVDFSLRNRGLVLIAFALITAAGIYNAMTIPIDAVPDMTNVQVQVITGAGSLSPLEVERLVTWPVEGAMGGLPGVEELRSISRLGLSVVTVVFREGTDLHFARNMVKERLPEAAARVGQYGNPEIGAMTTALGEIMQFEVRSENHSPMELRTILDWQIAPLLRNTPGVTEINTHGGFVRTFTFRIEPDRMAELQVDLGEVLAALERNNASVGGGYIVHHGEQRFVRGQATLKDAASISSVVVRNRNGANPILLKNLGTVEMEPLPRQGAVTRDGRGDVVVGMVMMLVGENSREVVEAAKARLQEIGKTLPPGVTTEVIYDRAELISRSLKTVVTNLFEGGALVIVVLFLFLGNVRAGLIVSLAIPLSMMFATNWMAATAISASLMSLGAIDFGLIVDSSVIIIENCISRLAHAPDGRSRFRIIRDAVIEVRRPTLFGELIIAVVFLPILALQGTEGKLFRPMALTMLFALFGSMVISMTLIPVLASLGLPRDTTEKEILLLRVLKAIYRPVVSMACAAPMVTVAVALGLMAACIPVGQRLGAEFMPRLDEGDLLVEAVRLPSASLEDSLAMSTQIENLLRGLPEVRTVFCKTGRPEIANDVMGVHQTDVWVMLRPHQQWPVPKTREQLIEEMSSILRNAVPGVAFGFTQPIEMRVDELVAGVKADVAVLLYGDDLEILAEQSKQIERLLKEIPGAVDVKADYQDNITALTIRVEPEKLARYGVHADQVLAVVSAMGGTPVGTLFEERARFPVLVRFPPAWRENMEQMKLIPVSFAGGTPITLGDLATLATEESPPGIEHEAGNRRTFIQANVRDRDVASFVQEAQARVESEIALPPGYLVRWGGDFENLQSASLRLALITPVVLLLIWFLLHSSFQSVRLTLLVFFAVPVAACGGILALALRGMPFSISAGVGFIALFGVAVLNSLVWVSNAERLRKDGMPLKQAALETALSRLRPVLMTALVASLGFLPMALATSAGAEIQRPLATVVIGGLTTATLLTTLVVPAIYPFFAPGRKEEEESDERNSED